MFNSFSRTSTTRTAAPRRRGRSARRNSPIRRLQLESLEQRLTLSGSPILVTSSADSGPGSLRDAITHAVSGETIKFAGSVHAITLTSGELAISTNLDIEGPGANKLTISGNNNSRVFDISGPNTVTIAGLTIANGKAVVTQPFGLDGGGGILNEAGATLYLNHSVLANNEAVLSPTIVPGTSNLGDVGGGGLLNEGTAYLNGTTVKGNEALGGGSFTAIGGSTGGGIDNYEGTLNVTNSAITNNQAISAANAPGGGIFFALGGGLANYGNINNASTASIDNSIVANNEATGGDGVVINGGGIENENTAFNSTYTLAVVAINNSTLSGNLAVGGAYGVGSLGSGAAEGGGIDSDCGLLTINNSTLSDNEAMGGNHAAPAAGGIASPATGAGQGGGIVNFTGSATVSNCALIGNKAIGGTTDSGPGAIADGGGISNWGSAVDGVPGILTVSNTTFIGNEAIAGQGAPGPYTTVWGFAAGGGLDDAFSGNATLTNCTLIGNQAIGSNGANGGTGFGGGISVGFSAFFSTPGNPIVDNSTLQLSNSTLLGNVARGGNGGATGTGGDGLGGGLAINPGSSANVTHSAIDFNLALGGSGGTSGHGIGGGVYNNGTFDDLLTLLAFNFASTSNNNIFP